MMASYAPLFAHVDARQWGPDMIWFDNLRAFGTPSYYVQKMFAGNVGTTELPVTIDPASDGLYVCASRDDASGEVILKVVNAQPEVRTIRVDIPGAKTGDAKLEVMSAEPEA